MITSVINFVFLQWLTLRVWPVLNPGGSVSLTLIAGVVPLTGFFSLERYVFGRPLVLRQSQMPPPGIKASIPKLADPKAWFLPEDGTMVINADTVPWEVDPKTGSVFNTAEVRATNKSTAVVEVSQVAALWVNAGRFSDQGIGTLKIGEGEHMCFQPGAFRISLGKYTTLVDEYLPSADSGD